MKLVIEIPKEKYECIKKNNPNVDINSIVGAVANGTPLPKEHGRLIDEKELLEMTKSYKSELGRLKADPFVKCGIETVEGFIQDVPTIVEADKEGEKK